jgi:hypothetical protein
MKRSTFNIVTSNRRVGSRFFIIYLILLPTYIWPLLCWYLCFSAQLILRKKVKKWIKLRLQNHILCFKLTKHAARMIFITI